MQKSTCFTAILFVWAFTLSAQTIQFQQGSWEDIKTRAEKEHKGIFVDVYTSWCVPCKKMATTVFNDSTVAAYMNRYFISVQLDAEKEASHELFNIVHPNGYPSFYWFDATGSLADSHVGYMPSEDFIKKSQQAQENNLGQLYNTYRERWQAGERDHDFITEFLFGVMPKINPDSVRPYFNIYLQELPPEELKKLRTASLVRKFAHSITDDTVWRTLVSYNDIYQTYFGYTFGKQLYMNLVRIPMADRNDTLKYQRDLACIAAIDFPYKKMYEDIRDMETKLFQKKYAGALKQALSIGEMYEESFPYLYAEMFYTFIIADFFKSSYKPTKEELKNILILGQKAFDNLPSQCTLMYLAAAYARNSDFRKAYETLVNIPFYGEPTLSSAVYSLLNLERIAPAKRE